MKLKIKWFMFAISFLILVSSVLVVEENVFGAEMHKESLTEGKHIVAKKIATKKKTAKKKEEIRKFEKEILPAYEKYVREHFSEAVAHKLPYSFIYLNNDNIPELVVEGEYEFSGNLICTYYNGVVALNTARLSLGYVERKNILHNPFAHMGYYSDDVYSIKKGKFVKIWSGYYEDHWDGKNPIEYTYYYKGAKISEKKYNAKLKKALGNNNDTTGEFIKGSTIREAYKKFKKAKGI